MLYRNFLSRLRHILHLSAAVRLMCLASIIALTDSRNAFADLNTSSHFVPPSIKSARANATTQSLNGLLQNAALQPISPGYELPVEPPEGWWGSLLPDSSDKTFNNNQIEFETDKAGEFLLHNLTAKKLPSNFFSIFDRKFVNPIEPATPLWSFVKSNKVVFPTLHLNIGGPLKLYSQSRSCGSVSDFQFGISYIENGNLKKFSVGRIVESFQSPQSTSFSGSCEQVDNLPFISKVRPLAISFVGRFADKTILFMVHDENEGSKHSVALIRFNTDLTSPFFSSSFCIIPQRFRLELAPSLPR